MRVPMTFPFLIRGEIKVSPAGHGSEQVVLEKLAEAVKREGASDIAINGDTLEFVGVTGQLSGSSLVNIDRSAVTVSFGPNFLCLRYVARPERWAAYVGVIVILLGIATWLISILPLQLTSGFRLPLLTLSAPSLPLFPLRSTSLLRRSFI